MHTITNPNGHSPRGAETDAQGILNTSGHDGNSDSNSSTLPSQPEQPDAPDKPDIWNYGLVGVLLVFYAAGFISTYVSSSLLLHLLSGGNILVPMFSTQVSITEAVACMGTGILEGASLSDAYMEHKKVLSGHRKWGSQGGRFLAFVGQWLLYYMALGTLLFATVDTNSLSGQGLGDSEISAQPEAALVLEPPTPLHGAFVGTLTGAWSFGTTYLGPNALLLAITALRRKRKAQPDEEAGWEVLLQYVLAQLEIKLQDLHTAEVMDGWAAQLRVFLTGMDSSRAHNLSSDMRVLLGQIINELPDSVIKQSGLPRETVQKRFSTVLSDQQRELPKLGGVNATSTSSTPPRDWYRK